MPMSPLPTPRPIASGDVAWTAPVDEPCSGVRARPLTRAAGGEGGRIDMAIEELASGGRSGPPYYRLLGEEHVFVLEGALTLRLGAEVHAMQRGDYACFPAGQQVGYQLVNDGEAVCRYVAVRERVANETIVFPDAGRVLLHALGRYATLDAASPRNVGESVDTASAGDGMAPPETRGDDAVDRGVAIPDAFPPIAAQSVAWHPEGDGPRFGGRSRHLTHAAVGAGYRAGVLIEAPAPGMRLWPKHYHMVEEEHVLVLEGRARLLFGDECIDMAPGDYVWFPAGQKIGHAIMNVGDGPCRYLIVGERSPHDVSVYPDSNKVGVKALRSEDAIFDMAAVRGYWDGEQRD